jgi:hypothetical protein
MEHVQYMFMFDNVSGWVDENPPFSHCAFTVTWYLDGEKEGTALGFDDAAGVNWCLDKLGELTDDRT